MVRYFLLQKKHAMSAEKNSASLGMEQVFVTKVHVFVAKEKLAFNTCFWIFINMGIPG